LSSILKRFLWTGCWDVAGDVFTVRSPILGRIAVLRAYMRPTVTNEVAWWSVCQSVCLSLSWAQQKGWTDRDAVSVVDSGGPMEVCKLIGWGCTLSPPTKYDWTVNVGWRCGLFDRLLWPLVKFHQPLSCAEGCTAGDKELTPMELLTEERLRSGSDVMPVSACCCCCCYVTMVMSARWSSLSKMDELPCSTVARCILLLYTALGCRGVEKYSHGTFSSLRCHTATINSTLPFRPQLVYYVNINSINSLTENESCDVKYIYCFIAN